jgi:hypothetical protein
LQVGLQQLHNQMHVLGVHKRGMELYDVAVLYLKQNLQLCVLGCQQVDWDRFDCEGLLVLGRASDFAVLPYTDDFLNLVELSNVQI